MDIGVFHLMPWTEVEHGVGWPYSDSKFDSAIGSDLYDRYIDQLVYAEELGYDFVGVNEHHYNAYGLMPSPNIIAAALSQRTTDVDVAVLGSVLPLRDHPIRVAEEYAMLDNLLDGRLRAGFVRGIPSEYLAYGVDPNESRPRFQEAWHLIVEAWTNDEPFDWDGEFYDYDDVYIWPRPVQDPHPPLWMPAESEKSIRWAAQHRVPISSVYLSTSEMAEIFDLYREIAENEFNWSPTDDHFGPCRAIYVGETTEQAHEDVREHAEYFYDTLLGGNWRAEGMREVGDSEYQEEKSHSYMENAPDVAERFMNFDYEQECERGEFIVGDADYVAAEIERQYEEMGGFGYLTGLFQFGDMPHEKVVQNMERFADDVMPQIEGLSTGQMAAEQHPLPDVSAD